jgi:3-deoxy-D-manno-octulosonate 8-phosphate phosphatase (KDO 8-P phosphatase)
LPTDVNQLASRIKLLLMDVDGVLTDGRLYNVPGPDGQMVETKGFDSQDGIALQWLSWKGIKSGVISGRVSPATVERATPKKSPSSKKFSGMPSWTRPKSLILATISRTRL